MPATVINKTWTAFHDKLVFDFTLYPAEEHGVSMVKVFFTGEQHRRVHEIALALGQQHHFSLQFNFTTEGEVYVKGMLRRESHRHGDGTVHIGVFADIIYGRQQRHDEQHFEGFMLFIEVHAPVSPPDPAPGPQSEPDEPEPEPAPHLRFIRYLPAPVSPPGKTLYDALLAARPAGREAMETLARHYIAGDGGCEPPFLWQPGGLPAPLHRFADVALAAQQLCRQPPALRQRIAELLHADSDEQIAVLLAGSACREATAAAWQSYFALLVFPGRELALLATLTHFLGAVHLLDYLYAPASSPLAPPDAAALAVLANATVLLPDAVFPLPPRSA